MDTEPPSITSIAREAALAPRAKPFYPKALVCFIISSLCLGWLLSLQMQTASYAALNSQRSSSEAPKKADAPPPSVASANQSAVPAAELSEADFAIVEINLIHALVQEENAVDLRKAANNLRSFTYSTNAAVREAAVREMSHVLAAHDKTALKTITDAMAPADTLATKGDFGGAINLLQTTLKNLPEDAAWPGQGAEQKLKDTIAEYEKKRSAERERLLAGLEDALRKKDAAASVRLDQVLVHSDPDVRSAAQSIQQRVAEETDKTLLARRAQDRAAREDWVRFFKRFGATLGDGDFTAAAELIEQPPFEAILKGGVSDPDKVLRLCADDIKAIQNIYDEALKDAKGIRRQVSFRLRKGGQAAGTLVGTNGRQLRINPGKGAEMGIKITDLTSEGVKAIMDSGLTKKPAIMLALAALEAYEAPADAQNLIQAAYEKAREPLPLHWTERFRVEKLVQQTAAAEEQLAVLKKAVDSENGDDIKAALAAVKPVIAQLNELGALSDSSRELLQRAEQVTAKKALSMVTLQNGKSPEATYRGINTDQISDYRDSLRRTDVGVGYGLKLGAAGGLQRVLIKFDGLDLAVGKGRVRHATLQLYQTDSPKFEGAIIGLFRVKRAWVPDAGSWMSYDGLKDHDWALPGASGEADIEPREDTRVLLGAKANQWLSWDVTKYVQDVLGGKAQNNGLLFKIVNGEPEFHVRLYPETDLDRAKDATLRPKLVLDIARDLD